MSRAIAVAMVLQLFCAPGYGDDLREEAKLHHSLGKIAFDRERYADALAEFRKAYDLAPIPDLLFNIGRCQEELGDFGGAIASYRRYLTASPNAADRAEVQARIDHLGAQAVQLRSAPPVERPGAVETMAPPAAGAVAPAATSLTARAARPAPRRRLWWIGVVVGGAAVVAGVTALAIVFGSPQSPAAYRGNVSPGVAGISP